MSARSVEAVASRAVNVLCVVVIYLACELVIWGLSWALAPASIAFFAPILAMMIVFLAMAAASYAMPGTDSFYAKYIQSKISFINIHMSVGFPIPIVMLGATAMIQSRQIAYVVAAFVITNVVSWVAVFFVCLAATQSISIVSEMLRQPSESMSISSAMSKLICSSTSTMVNDSSSDSDSSGSGSGSGSGSDSSSDNTTLMMSEQSSLESGHGDAASEAPYDRWAKMRTFYPMVLSLTCALAIGAPVAAATGDSHVLDGCIVWFVWITAHRAQHLFKTSGLLPGHPTIRNSVVTLLNPVLMTTLALMGYVRARAAATPGTSLGDILDKFSGGRSLYELWTASVTGRSLPDNPDLYFGAGDAALSLLECGIVVWGFKLAECRRRMLTTAGLLTVVVSVAAAAGNVFLSVGCARLLGVEKSEALAFAARSTTLALAKPAIEAVGGNLGVNATLVVSNGILGQLVYPFILGVMGVGQEPAPVYGNNNNRGSRPEIKNDDGDRVESGLWDTGDSDDDSGSDSDDDGEAWREDDAMTVAAGIAIGINGAAMGVAYLYETRSRAAAYAALSMTVFGVMTVVFTTAEPFKGLVLHLAGA